MEYISPIFIAFMLVFLSELGDKTQLIAISFSSKMKIYKVLFGVALRIIIKPWNCNIFWKHIGKHK